MNSLPQKYQDLLRTYSLIDQIYEFFRAKGVDPTVSNFVQMDSSLQSRDNFVDEIRILATFREVILIEDIELTFRIRCPLFSSRPKLKLKGRLKLVTNAFLRHIQDYKDLLVRQQNVLHLLGGKIKPVDIEYIPLPLPLALPVQSKNEFSRSEVNLNVFRISSPLDRSARLQVIADTLNTSRNCLLQSKIEGSLALSSSSEFVLKKLHHSVRQCLHQNLGISTLYRHQSDALNVLLSGHNLAITSATSRCGPKRSTSTVKIHSSKYIALTFTICDNSTIITPQIGASPI